MKQRRTIFSVIKTIFVIFALLTALFSLVSSQLLEHPNRSYWGRYRFFTVLSNSMQPIFQAGDITVIEHTDCLELKEGDIISFYSSDPNLSGNIITHQIVQVTQQQGALAFVTKGIQSSSCDSYPVPAGAVIGKYLFRIPQAGAFFRFLKTPLGYFCMIFLPLLLISSVQAIRFFHLLEQSRKKQIQQLKQQQRLVANKYQEISRACQEVMELHHQLKVLLDQLGQQRR